MLAALPAAASAAKLTVGIGENDPAMFTDPLFPKLGVKDARLVVSYNVMTSGDDELARVRRYLAAARAATACARWSRSSTRAVTRRAATASSNRNKAQCRLPSAKTYERNIKLFLAAFPRVKAIVPWNEINHFTQPTFKKPKAAARFTKIARRACKGCTVLAADILDQADNTQGQEAEVPSATRYIKRFRRFYKGPRKICGIHNYSDINRFRSTGTKALVKALGCKQTGSPRRAGSSSSPASRRPQKRQRRRRSSCSSWPRASSASGGCTSTRTSAA